MKALVVDDEPTTRLLVKRLLRDLGWKAFEEAKDGKEAVQKLQAEPFDLLVLDWNMPEMTGLDLLKAVRADDNLKDLPVLVVTGEAKKSVVLEAMEAGASYYVVKPISPQAFQDAIAEVFKNR
ncbi:MAG: response regulator [Nitrospirota bacterium]